jgi:hypothetical protein
VTHCSSLGSLVSGSGSAEKLEMLHFFSGEIPHADDAGGDAHLFRLVKESTSVESQSNDKNRPEILQMMTTEHYNLQSGRSLALSEANGRAGLFLGTVSSSLIALAFVGNITHVGTQLGTAFFVFALVLFPSLFFLGLVTASTK